MTPFRFRAPLAPTRGRLGLALLVVVLALGWRLWSEVDRPDRVRDDDPPPRGSLAGRVHVVDGDSLVLAGARIRLAGIDAPERAQSCALAGMPHPCGAEAGEHLAHLIAGRSVACDWTRLDKYRRRLARCRAGDLDLGAAMVRSGWAVAYGAYEAEEADARAHGRGLWSGGFDWPENFRRDHRADRPVRLFDPPPEEDRD